MVGSDLKRLINSRLLVRYTDQLNSIIQSESLMTHLNNSRFTVLVASVSDVSSPIGMTGHVRRMLRAPIVLRKQRVFVDTDIKISSGLAKSVRTISFLHSTSATVCRTGGGNQNQSTLFSPRVCRRITARLALRDSLRQTLRQRRVDLRCRPVVGLRAKRLIKFRTLTH